MLKPGGRLVIGEVFVDPDFIGPRELRERLQATSRHLNDDFKTLLQSGIERMELVSREEFDLQRAVLERTRAKLEQMETRLAELEKALAGKP